jgi:hypothetical protein
MLQCVRAGERRILIVVDSCRDIERRRERGADLRANQGGARGVVRKTKEPDPIDVSELDLLRLRIAGRRRLRSPPP